MNTQHQKEFEETLELTNDEVVKNAKVVTPESLGQKEFFHIAKQSFKELVPNISKRGPDNEDNTLPRVHVSIDLVGCINGYGAVSQDITESDYSSESGYRGGYYLYFVPFEYSLQPNRKLIGDQPQVDEHWLITYNQETKTFTPSAIGRIVNLCTSFLPSTLKNGAQELLTLAVEVPKDARLCLDGKDWVSAGYWMVEVTRTNGKDLFKLHKYYSMTEEEFIKHAAEKTDRLTLEAHQTVLKAW